MTVKEKPVWEGDLPSSLRPLVKVQPLGTVIARFGDRMVLFYKISAQGLLCVCVLSPPMP